MRSTGPLIGQRHILVFIISIGMAILFASRSSLSVVLVAMVKQNTSNADSMVDNDCPPPKTNQSSTHHGGEFEWSRQLQGIILSCYFWGYLALQVPSGSLAQRYGSKWLLAGGLFCLSALNLLLPICAQTSPYLMITLLVLMGVGSSVTFPAVFAMMGRWAPPQESTRLTTYALSGSYLGTVVGELYAGPLSESQYLGGWPSVFYLNGVIGLLWVAAWTALAFNSPDEHPRISEKELDYINTSLESNQKEANRLGVPWCKLLFSREMAIYIPLSFTLGWVSYTIVTCLPQFMSDVLHVSLSSNSLLVSLPMMFEFIVSNTLTHVADQVIARKIFSKLTTRKFFTIFGFGGCALSFISISFVGCDAIVIVSLLVIGFGFFGSIYSGYFVMPLDISPEYSGVIFGVGNLFTTAAGIAAPIFTGAVTATKTRQAWSYVFIVSGALSGTAGLFHLLFGRSQRRQWNVKDEVDEKKNLLAKNQLYS